MGFRLIESFFFNKKKKKQKTFPFQQCIIRVQSIQAFIAWFNCFRNEGLDYLMSSPFNSYYNKHSFFSEAIKFVIKLH